MYLAEGSAYSSFLNDHEEEQNLIGIEYSFHTDSPSAEVLKYLPRTLPWMSHSLLSHTYPYHLSHELLSVPPQSLQGCCTLPAPLPPSPSSHAFSPKQAGLGQERTGIRWDL